MSNFKVGDWIEVNGDYEQLSQIDYNKYLKNNNYLDGCELWQPTEGEWCWFDKNKLGKFWKKQGTRNYWTLSDFVSISEKTKIPSGDYFVSDYCEPFIGELPSFIKDKQ